MKPQALVYSFLFLAFLSTLALGLAVFFAWHTVAMLASPTIWTLFTASLFVLLCGIVWVASWVHSAVVHRALDIQEHKQAIQIKELQKYLVHGDSLGNKPVIIGIDPQSTPITYLPSGNPAFAPHGHARIVEENKGEPLQLPEPEIIYPQAPAFARIAHKFGPGSGLILGYNTDGPIFGDITDLLSMGFIGRPGTGKSSALLYYLGMLLLSGASVHVFDPQGSLNELADFLPYYGSYSEFADPVYAIQEELAEREELWRHGRQVKEPLLVLVDELPSIAGWEQKNKPEVSVLDLAGKIVLEHRKHNVFALLTGQSLPASVLPTLTRDNLSSRLVFNSSSSHARMAGLDEESRKKLLPLLKRAKPGTAILDVSRRSDPDIAAIPYTTIDDLRTIVDADEPRIVQEPFNAFHKPVQAVSRVSRDTPSEREFLSFARKPESAMNTPVKSVESIPEFSEEDETQILQIARTMLATTGKVSRAKIPAAMNPPRNNSIYPIVKYLCNREGF